MRFTPKDVQQRIAESAQQRSYALDQWQRRALFGLLFMVLLTFTVSNMWAVMWQASDWLTATILPAVVVDLTNEERAAGNLTTLVRSSLLDEAARRKAEHMAAESYFAHYSPDGIAPWHWFREVDYHFAHAGENLAVHFTDSRAMVQAWMDSPTHRANIENQQFTEIGVGTARGRYNGHDTIFVVQMFGTPAQVAAPTAGEPPTPVSEPVAVATATDPELTPTGATEETPPTAVGVGEAESAELLVTEPTATASEAEAVGGAGADPVEVAEDERIQEPSARLVEQEAEGNEVDTASLATAASEGESPLTGTSSRSYLVHSAADDSLNQIERWESTTYTISTGLPVATNTAGTTSGSFSGPLMMLSTQPNSIMQITYTVLSVLTAGMILWAFQLEARRRRYVQMAYSVGLLAMMGGLWYVHVTVSGGGVVT